MNTAFDTTRVVLWGWLAVAPVAAAQTSDAVQRARDAETTTEVLAAIEQLSAEVQVDPSPDAFLYLGLAHADLQQYSRALELFEEGAARYPTDPRFLDETAGVYLAERNVEDATDALERALAVDPADTYASDLLASIHLSENRVEEALTVWNAIGQPRIDQIFQNFSPGFLDRAVPRALAFGSGDLLTYGGWKTSESRLLASHLYSNTGLVIEPSPAPDLYNAVVRTTARTNSVRSVLVGLVRGLPIETTYFDLNDIGDSAVGWRSDYRWDEDRRRLRGRVIVPLPLPGLPVVEFYDTWRFERWDVTGPLLGADPSGSSLALGLDPRFDYKANAFGFSVRAIPHFRVEVGAGFEYRNRDTTGFIPRLGLDERNSALFRFEAAVRAVDGRYKSRISARGFIARASLLGDFDFTGGAVQLANRLEFDERARTTLDFAITGGTARGALPVDHYFVLGLGSVADYRLRGHVTSDHGRYGRGPMGTDFVLTNVDIRRHLMTIPLFDTFGVPFIEVRALGFYDAAKVFDRQRVFSQGEWMHDLGAGLRFETATSSFTVLYGRDIVGGEDALYGYAESRFW